MTELRGNGTGVMSVCVYKMQCMTSLSRKLYIYEALNVCAEWIVFWWWQYQKLDLSHIL